MYNVHTRVHVHSYRAKILCATIHTRVHSYIIYIYLDILLENKYVCVKINNVVGTLLHTLWYTPHTDTSLCSKDASTPSIPGTNGHGTTRTSSSFFSTLQYYTLIHALLRRSNPSTTRLIPQILSPLNFSIDVFRRE